jgi:hypothetical protein
MLQQGVGRVGLQLLTVVSVYCWLVLSVPQCTRGCCKPLQRVLTAWTADCCILLRSPVLRCVVLCPAGCPSTCRSC